MKRILILSLLPLFCLSCNSPEVKSPAPYVDERIELLNIVFRLAEVPSYQSDLIKPYIESIDNYFAEYRDHELINFTAELFYKFGISYDAVVSYAVLLDIKDGEVLFKNDVILEFDDRWQADNPQLFLHKLNDFYREVNFRKFFNDCHSIYQRAVDNYINAAIEIDYGWFDRYFGKKSDDIHFHIILNILDNEYNYGPKATFNNGREDMYAILSAHSADNEGYPIYKRWSYDVVIHELLHSFVNPLVDIYSHELNATNELFYNFSAEKLRTAAGVGTSKLMKYETLVRACEIQYHKAHSEHNHWRKRLYSEQRHGFIWLEALCDLLSEEYETSRRIYSDMYSFMPQIIQTLNGISLEELTNDFYSKCARVCKSSITDGATDVDPATNILTFTFDKPMYTGANSYDIRPGKLGKTSIPRITDVKWSDDAKELVLTVELEPITDYSIVLSAHGFLGENNEPLADFYHIQFQTSN